MPKQENRERCKEKDYMEPKQKGEEGRGKGRREEEREVEREEAVGGREGRGKGREKMDTALVPNNDNNS